MCAGKTTKMIVEFNDDWKHPRVCGEDPKSEHFPQINLETPPCVRGRRLLNKNEKGKAGNTPVCAGKTQQKQ